MNSTADESSGRRVAVSAFPPTLWTLVLEAARGDNEESQAALRQLCVLYREPIRRWLERHGTKTEQVEDLTQGFIEHLLEGNRLKGITREGPKFRTYLIECLQRFARGAWRKQRAAKRGGGAEPADLADAQLAVMPELDKLLDLDFALTVHQQALTRLETEECAAEPKRTRFAELRGFIWSNDQEVSYAEVGQRLHMSANHLKKAVFDLRRHYYRCFREEVVRTVLHESADEETRYLMTLLAERGLAE